MRTLVDANIVLRYMLRDDDNQFPTAEQAIRNGAYLLPEVLAEVVSPTPFSSTLRVAGTLAIPLLPCAVWPVAAVAGVRRRPARSGLRRVGL